jgi:hypothetical protein
MKTETKTAPDVLALNPSTGWSMADVVRPTRPVRLSQTQSNLVQPNPTTRPPPGKETVKFLADFDHACHSTIRPPNLLPLLKFRLSALDLAA